MTESNTPKVNFDILKDMIFNYYQTTQDNPFKGYAEISPRAERYYLESELTSLDFIQEELRALLNDTNNRARLLTEQLDNRV